VPDVPRSAPPRFGDSAWRGGFVIESPVYTASIAAGGGTVVAATECIYRLRPGATAFQVRDTPEGFGDVVAVAVEPRRASGPARFAAATMDALHVFDGKGGFASVKFPEDHGEVLGLMWAPRKVDEGVALCLHVRFADFLLLLVPDAGPTGTFVRSDWPAPHVCAMAADGADGVAFAAHDEENDDLDVWVWERATDTWLRRSIPMATSSWRVHLAVAGTAAAVTLGDDGGVWLTRNVRQHDFVELESLRGLPTAEGGAGSGPIAFAGASADAALFAAVHETPRRLVIARVSPGGRPETIADLMFEQGDERGRRALIHAMAWDATRRTLFTAAGRAGVGCSTEPGVPPPFGKNGAKRALS